MVTIDDAGLSTTREGDHGSVVEPRERVVGKDVPSPALRRQSAGFGAAPS